MEIARDLLCDVKLRDLLLYRNAVLRASETFMFLICYSTRFNEERDSFKRSEIVSAIDGLVVVRFICKCSPLRNSRRNRVRMNIICGQKRAQPHTTPCWCGSIIAL